VRSRSWGCAVPAEDQESAPALFALVARRRDVLQLVNAGARRLVLLALGGSGDHEGRDGLAWASWEDDSPGRPPQEIPLPEDLPSG